MAGKIFIISAPSGAGKTTLVHALLAQYASHYSIERLITYTSRAPRVIEKAGYDYHFISNREFEEKIEQGFFLEYSTAYGAYYGISRALIAQLSAGKSYLIVVDRQGARSLKEKIDNAIAVWLYTDLPTLEERLYARATDTKEQIAKRLAIAQQEMDEENKTNFWNYRLFNQNLSDSLLFFESIFHHQLINV